MMNTSKLMGAFFALLLFGCLCAPAAAARGVVTTELRNPIRSGPSAEYARITVLPAGVKLWATDKEGQWYRIRLSSVLEAWTHEGNVDVLDSGQSVDTARLTDISVTPQDRNHRVIFYLSRPVPFRIRQSVVPPQLRVDLFNCSAAQEMIRHFPGSQSIRISPAQQLANGWVEIAIDLPNTHQTGYQARFSSSGHLLLDINKSFRSADLAGKRIAIDPGHGGSDTGAVGPTGLTEKEVNLRISSLLRERLETAGAEVVLTRYTDTAVAPGSGKSGELEARVQTTKAAGADVFVSVHNNAVGGGDPTRASGTESYYWTPMSHLLASTLQDGLVSALGTRDRFVSWQRFYVLRDTDCPRALVECAFMSNPEEEEKLRNRAFLASAAHGLFQGLQSYFRAAIQPPAVPGPVPLEIFPSPLTGTFPHHQLSATGS